MFSAHDTNKDASRLERARALLERRGFGVVVERSAEFARGKCDFEVFVGKVVVDKVELFLDKFVDGEEPHCGEDLGAVSADAVGHLLVQ